MQYDVFIAGKRFSSIRGADELGTMCYQTRHVALALATRRIDHRDTLKFFFNTARLERGRARVVAEVR